ncbi:putative non-specific serine/threonine protein kinase [Rosa chinensis]|uniref:Putative non-specific serine/threonine protein kinase n=1 Tax=Rosa chinensis TaxID=74649 RepID=A0A2P6QNL3_ROSCH|nr:putative non-specific serine/threonine protein kinase [Rosa chinensis]
MLGQLQIVHAIVNNAVGILRTGICYAPMRGHLTEKTDVFAYGVVILEIVSGRPNSDPSLEGEMVYLLKL